MYGDGRLAALDAASAAGALASLKGHRCGDRKKRKGKQGCDGELHNSASVLVVVELASSTGE
jgi:hypothetical protein